MINKRKMEARLQLMDMPNEILERITKYVVGEPNLRKRRYYIAVLRVTCKWFSTDFDIRPFTELLDWKLKEQYNIKRCENEACFQKSREAKFYVMTADKYICCGCREMLCRIARNIHK